MTKAFDFAPAAPIPITINGNEYELSGKIPPGVMAELTASTTVLRDGRTVCEAGAMVRFLGRLMNDTDRASFEDQVQNDMALDNDNLGEVVNWLLTERSERPTELPISSPDGQSPAPALSEVTP